MAKRSSHLHASPLVLSLGLLAVMAFAIIAGVSQLNNNQDARSRAAELDTKTTMSDCNVISSSPYQEPGTVRVHGHGYVWCNTIKTTLTFFASYITVDGQPGTTVFYPSGGNCTNCKSLNWDGYVTKSYGTHVYCTHSRACISPYGVCAPWKISTCWTGTR